MKKIKGLLCTLVVLLLMPFTVFADSKEKINVYIFKGDGCGFCAKALTFFEGLDEEYQSYFNLVEKEVWYDEDHAALMQEVASYFGEDVSGVPYIIIGEKTFQGFDESQYGDSIKAAIKAGYENTDGSYKDVVASISGGETTTSSNKDDDNNSAITIIVIIVAIAGIGFLIYMARDDAEEVVEEKEEIQEEVKTTKKAAPTKTAPKKTAAKKTTTTKKKTTNKK